MATRRCPSVSRAISKNAALRVGVAAVAVDVLDVERAQRRPVARLQLRAGGGPKGEPVLRRHPALLAHLLAVLRAKGRQVVLEALERAPRAVVPVELHAEAREVAARGQDLFLSVGAEEKVDRRGLLLLGDLAHAPEQRRDDRRRVDVRRVEQRQAAAGGRREGDRRHQLGVVADARAMRGVRPGPVEDELAVAVGLEVERHRAEQSTAVAGEHDPRDAAGRLADAPRRLQRREERMLEKRIVVARQPIPLAGRDGRDALDDLQLDDARA